MKLKTLNITLNTYGENRGHYTSLIEYECENGKIETRMSPEVSERLLAYLAPVLTSFASQGAKEIEQNILASVREAKQLPEITV